jgi:putative ABC transport system permease protein
VLKGRFQASRYSTVLRNGLVVFQFAISMILIICTVIVHEQMQYMLGDQLGFTRDHVLEIQRSDLVGDKIRAFRSELASLAGVERVGGASSLPGDEGFLESPGNLSIPRSR